MRLLILGSTLIALGCARSPAPQPPPVFAPQQEAEVRPLLLGVWKLQTIDGEPADGWLTFTDNDRGHHVSFSLKCGTQHGYYSLHGNIVTPDLRVSVGPDCDADDVAGSPVRVPELLHRPFEVNVSQRGLVVRGQGRWIAPSGLGTFARHTRKCWLRCGGLGRSGGKRGQATGSASETQ